MLCELQRHSTTIALVLHAAFSLIWVHFQQAKIVTNELVVKPRAFTLTEGSASTDSVCAMHATPAGGGEGGEPKHKTKHKADRFPLSSCGLSSCAYRALCVSLGLPSTCGISASDPVQLTRPQVERKAGSAWLLADLIKVQPMHEAAWYSWIWYSDLNSKTYFDMQAVEATKGPSLEMSLAVGQQWAKPRPRMPSPRTVA